MKSFLLERPVVSSDLDQAIASFRRELEIPLELIEPTVVVFSKRMSQRAIMAEEESGGRVVTEKIAELANRQSRDIRINLGHLSIVGADVPGEKKYMGFKIAKGKKPDARATLLNERMGLATHFGIGLHEPERSFKSFYVVAFPFEGYARKNNDKLIQQWRQMHAGRQLAATLTGLRLRILEEDN